MARSKETQDALDRLEFMTGEVMLLRWDIGFNDRGLGHGDFAVICQWPKQEFPVVVVQCPTREVAEHIVNTHNTLIEST
jgi:hypothetical protein